MGFLLGIRPNCEKDRRGPYLPLERWPPGLQSEKSARPRRVRHRGPVLRSWPACRSVGVKRPPLRYEAKNRWEDQPTGALAGCRASSLRAMPLVSTPAGPRPKATNPACSSDCRCRNDRRRFRSRTPSDGPGTGAAAAENGGSNDSLAGFFTPGKTQFKVEPPRDRGASRVRPLLP